MKKKKVYKYTCYECSKYCTTFRTDTPNEVDDFLRGYDDINDCEYNYQLEGEYKEEK